MRAMVYDGQRGTLVARDLAPVPLGPGDVRLAVHACGVCRTDLHVVDDELPAARRPIVPGHEIVGTVIERGPGAERFRIGERIGVPWLAGTCGACDDCRNGRENLCTQARFTGYHRDGGYAEQAIADERFCFAIPPDYDDVSAAPLLCAGLIGHRALRAAGEGSRLGIYGFGAAAHLVAQVARIEGREVYAFTREGDDAAQALARRLGARWAGASTGPAPVPLDAAILFAPAGELVPAALRAVRPGGRVVCAGIHMSDIPSFPYAILWGERSIRSIANLTRADGEAFFALAARHRLDVTTTAVPLSEAQRALDDLRAGRTVGAAVLVPAADPSEQPDRP